MNVKQKICALSGHPQHRSQFTISRFEVHRVSIQCNSRDYASGLSSHFPISLHTGLQACMPVLPSCHACFAACSSFFTSLPPPSLPLPSLPPSRPPSLPLSLPLPSFPPSPFPPSLLSLIAIYKHSTCN